MHRFGFSLFSTSLFSSCRLTQPFFFHLAVVVPRDFRQAMASDSPPSVSPTADSRPIEFPRRLPRGAREVAERFLSWNWKLNRRK
uniref:Secreted protein n=1 Tax=Steinernema glaseri TaxID=37863 RepID=A0A1I7ZQU5_9BILA